MIGWVPHVLTDFVEQTAGPAVRSTVLKAAGFTADERFHLHVDYPDAFCRRIIDAACTTMGVSETHAFRLFAPFFIAQARSSFPGFFTARPDLRDFLLHQPEIHETLSAGLADRRRGEVAAKFRVEPAIGGVRVFYRSPNRLAGLYAAVAEHLGQELDQPVQVDFEAGTAADTECIMLVTFQHTYHKGLNLDMASS